jgi:hypothetical protein
MKVAKPLYLPQELADHIIDHLHDNPLALRRCSLVCHAWLPTSRLHLFSKIAFRASPDGCPSNELCKRLYALLSTSPDIIPNIHELEITEGALFGAPGYPAGVPSTTWVATERTLPRLLKMLTHLQRFEFGAHTTLYWGTLPSGLQNAICHVFKLPSLTYVRLKSWSFPNFAVLADLLSNCQNLKGLALSSTVVGVGGEVGHAAKLGTREIAVGEGGDVDSTRRCSLEFLTIDYVDFGSLGHWLLSQRSTIEIKGLRELRVAHFHDVTAIEQLLAVTGSSLEHFHLKPGPWDGRYIFSSSLAGSHPRTACILCSSALIQPQPKFRSSFYPTYA